MYFQTKRLCLAFASAAMLALAACGGGSSSVASGSSSGGGSGSSSLSGTAAVGAPISGVVVAIDVNGKVSPPATTSALGAFVVDVSGMTAPFILNIVGTANGKAVSLNSVATAVGQTVNITPLTDLIVSTASGRPGGSSLAALCAPTVTAECKAALSAASTPDKLNAAVAAVISMIAPLNTAGTNPLTGSFRADGTGLDAVLDQILVTPAAAQNAQATITLLATNTTIGSVTMPGTAGQTSTTVATAPASGDLTKAQAAANVLPQIKACMASFNAMYTAANIGSLDESKIDPFIDSTFRFGAAETKDVFKTILNTELKYVGFAFNVAGLSRYNMSPLTSGERSQIDDDSVNAVSIVKARGPGITYVSDVPSTAWVQIQVANDAGLMSWRMVKGTPYAGCEGGWKIAGSRHLDMHMNARITRVVDGSGNASYTRDWALHMEKSTLVAERGSSVRVVVRGPGLVKYTGPTNPVGDSKRVNLYNDSGSELTLSIESGSTIYGFGDALQSCQDLAAANVPAPSTDITCVDENVAKPGSLFAWEIRTGTPASSIVESFVFELSSVPMSKAFAQANAGNLFATLTSKTPASIAALATATNGRVAGEEIGGIITYNYSQGTAYGSRMDNCRINLNGNETVAEQPAVGKETSCTFVTGEAEGLVMPASAITTGSVGLTTTVLGNQASSIQPY